MASRRFTEKQLADVMRRAAEIQARESTASGNEGISEQEFRAAAHELGIGDPAIDAALADLDLPTSGDRAGLWGGPFRRDLAGVFEGRITDEKWEMLVADLRRTFGEAGSVERRGETYEWVGIGGGIDNKTITIRQSGESIRVDLSSEFGGYGILSFPLMLVPFFVSVAILSEAHLSTQWTLAILFGWSLLLFLAARAIAVQIGRKRAQKLSQFMNRAGKILTAETPDLVSSQDSKHSVGETEDAPPVDVRL